MEPNGSGTGPKKDRHLKVSTGGIFYFLGPIGAGPVFFNFWDQFGAVFSFRFLNINLSLTNYLFFVIVDPQSGPCSTLSFGAGHHGSPPRVLVWGPKRNPYLWVPILAAPNYMILF